MIGFRNLYKTSLTGQQVADGGVKGVLENCFYRPAASKNYSREDVCWDYYSGEDLLLGNYSGEDVVLQKLFR